MGIGILWDQIGEGEVTDIAEYASNHYQKTGRLLRIAIDTACWIYNNVTKVQTAQIRESSGRPSNPLEKAILHRLLRLLHIGIQLHFVFDGPKRPPKRGITWRSTHDKSTDLLVKTLDMLELQKRGIVDAVWTEDGDAFMFGCTTLIRFHYEKKQVKDSKSNTHFRVYRAEGIPKRLPGLDRDGFVLYVILNGGDYDKAGLRGFGLASSLEAVKAGLGKSLYRAAESDLSRWREELVQHLKDIGSKVVVPAAFPIWEHLRDYREPLITHSLSSKWQQSRPIIEAELKPFVQEYYNFQAEKWVEWIVPMLHVRSLMQTGPGQELSNAAYHVEIGKQKTSSIVKATFLLSAATSLDMTQYSKMKEGNFYESDFRGSCETLPWILKRGVPDVVEAQPLVGAKKPNPKKGPAAQLGDTGKTSSDGKEASGTIGKKRGRPRKNANQDNIFTELDSNLRLESSVQYAKRRLSNGMLPALKKSKQATSKPSSSIFSSTTSRQTSQSSTSEPVPARQRQGEIIDLISDDEAESPNPVKKPKQPPSSRPSREEKAFNAAPALASNPKQSILSTPPKKFLKWNFEDDFGDSD